mmetsp:Transcript_76531/g.127571  ORF Transcript_76531/g.127571 Transcript_76531/m.127571 type:complete len:587 (-) Transcript_76531:164-1924(-)
MELGAPRIVLRQIARRTANLLAAPFEAFPAAASLYFPAVAFSYAFGSLMGSSPLYAFYVVVFVRLAWPARKGLGCALFVGLLLFLVCIGHIQGTFNSAAYFTDTATSIVHAWPLPSQHALSNHLTANWVPCNDTFTRNTTLNGQLQRARELRYTEATWTWTHGALEHPLPQTFTTNTLYALAAVLMNMYTPRLTVLFHNLYSEGGVSAVDAAHRFIHVNHTHPLLTSRIGLQQQLFSLGLVAALDSFVEVVALDWGLRGSLLSAGLLTHPALHSNASLARFLRAHELLALDTPLQLVLWMVVPYLMVFVDVNRLCNDLWLLWRSESLRDKGCVDDLSWSLGGGVLYGAAILCFGVFSFIVLQATLREADAAQSALRKALDTHAQVEHRLHRYGRIVFHSLVGFFVEATAYYRSGATWCAVVITIAFIHYISFSACFMAALTLLCHTLYLLMLGQFEANPLLESIPKVRSRLTHWPPALDVPASADDDTSMPEAFICPISQQIMRLPVMTRAGTTYDHAPLVQWAKTHHRYPANESTNQLSVDELVPNLALRNLIEDWLQTLPKPSPTWTPSNSEQSGKCAEGSEQV